jgi:HAD superfamily hydrolase (TIGR01549 family)
MIKWLFFDWDGTLLPEFGDYFWLEAFPRLLAEERGISISEAKQAIYSLEVDNVRFTDVLSRHTVRWLSFEPWAEQLGTKITFEHVFAAAESRLRMPPETMELLRDLSAHYYLGLITNCVSRFLQLCLAKLQLEKLFTVRVSCDQVGVAKPNPLIFRTALRIAGCRPDEAVYIGDKFADDSGCLNLGMQLIYVQTGRFTERIPPGIPVIKSLLELPELLSKNFYAYRKIK